MKLPIRMTEMYYGFDLASPSSECYVRPDGRFVTSYATASIGPDGVETWQTMLLWEWEPEQGGVVIDSCRVGDASDITTRERVRP